MEGSSFFSFLTGFPNTGGIRGVFPLMFCISFLLVNPFLLPIACLNSNPVSYLTKTPLLTWKNDTKYAKTLASRRKITTKILFFALLVFLFDLHYFIQLE